MVTAAAKKQARVATDQASESREMQTGESTRSLENKSRGVTFSLRSSSNEEQGTIEATAGDYTSRALAARVKQGLPPVVQDRTVLSKVSAMMAETLGKAEASRDDQVA